MSDRKVRFMIDIETSGVDFKKDDILEIAILELEFDGSYWLPLREYHTFVHSNKQPENEFSKTHMVEVFKNANGAEPKTPERIRQEILGFVNGCGFEGKQVEFVGWNASNFDIPFLQEKSFLKKSGYITIDGKDQFVGDCHYRVYEMGGAIQLAADVLGIDYHKACEQAVLAFVMTLPEGKEHDAMFDCYNQTKMLNGLIHMLAEYDR